MNQAQSKPKSRRALGTANKLFFFAAMLVSIGTAAQQRTFVKSVSVNYATKQVTFNISWAAGSRGVPGTSGANIYNSKVWVWVDYQPVTNPNATGTWQRATVDLSKLPAGCTADGSNTRGFWYQGQATAAQNANITVTLTNVPDKFSWCIYVSDCPPRAIYSNGTYTLKGTPPFEITYNNGSATVTNSKNFTAGTITIITDATKCPGYVEYSYSNCNASNLVLGTVGFVSTQTWTVGSQTWSAPVTATYCNKNIFNGGAENGIHNADCRNNSQDSYGHLFSWCMVAQYALQLCPSPWRVPTENDFCNLDKTLNGRIDCNARVDLPSINRYMSASFGGKLSGICAYNGVLSLQGNDYNIWAANVCDMYNASHLGVSTLNTNAIAVKMCHPKSRGYTVRCVR